MLYRLIYSLAVLEHLYIRCAYDPSPLQLSTPIPRTQPLIILFLKALLANIRHPIHNDPLQYERPIQRYVPLHDLREVPHIPLL